MGFIRREKVIRFLISLSVALFIWGYVTNMQNPIQKKTFNNIPVTFVNVDYLESQNLSVNSKIPLTVNVVVEGRYSDMQSFEDKDIKAVLDFQDLALKEGVNTIPLDVTCEDNSIFIVKEKTDLQVKVVMEKLLQKEFPVVVSTEGELAPGYTAGEPIISKEKVLVLGTKDSLNEIKYISIPIRFSTNTKESIHGTFSVEAYNKAGEVSSSVIVKDKELELSIPIYCSKTLPVKVVTSNQPQSGKILKSAVSNPKAVMVFGLAEDINVLTHINTQPISLNGRSKGFSRSIELELPVGVKVKHDLSEVKCDIVIEKK